MAVRSARVATPARCHCRGQRLLDEVGLRLPAVVPIGQGEPDTAPVPRPGRLPQPGPNRPARANPGGVPRTNRPSRGPGGPTGPRPTGPGRHRAGTAGVTRRAEPVKPPSSQGRRRMQRGVAHYQFLDGDKVRVSTTRGHAIVASTPWELWHGLRQCHVEAEIAAYARWQGETGDLEALTELDDKTELPAMRPTVTVDELAAREEKRRAVSYSIHSISRPDTASPADWTPLEPDDKGEPWQSPNGRVWYSRRVIDRIRRKRAALGLATSWAELHGTDVPEATVDLDERAEALG